MLPLIETSNLHKKYTIEKTSVHVLRGVSFQVCAGETVAIVGRSGAGKSTLLHVLGGLDRPDTGSVAFKGRDLYRQTPRRRNSARARDIGFVFQCYHLLPELDVFENAILPAMSGRGPFSSRRAVRERGMELLEAVGLADHARHRPTELSGGEQQRLALARALMNDPEILLADEPTGNLDSTTSEQVLSYVFGLTQQRKHTLLMVTHNDMIAARCDRVLNLVDGILE